MSAQLNLSVVVVSDYEGDGEKTWKDEHLILKALAEQDIDEPFKIIMVENVRAKDSAPDELYKMVPDLKIVFSEESQSAKLKDFGITRVRMNNMRSDDHKFYFEPEAVMRHALGGFGFIRDFRRNTGYADMLSHSRQTYSSIPELLWRRRVAEYKDCLRLGPKHLKWRDWPLTSLLWLIVPFFEILGMIDALKKRGEIPHSSYR